MENNKISIIKSLEEEKKYKILFKFYKKNTNIGFVAFTDFSRYNIDNINVYYGTFKDGDMSNVSPVQDEKDIKIMDELLEKFKKNCKQKLKNIQTNY